MDIQLVPNFIGGTWCKPSSGMYFAKVSPHTGQELWQVARSNQDDVEAAITAARQAQSAWAALTPVARGDFMRDIALSMKSHLAEIAEVVAAETGKSYPQAVGETEAAIEMGMFVAGEGRRNYGRTTTSSMAHRTVMTVRQPLGVAGLIIAANTPIANVAWKAFPAMFCGNTAIMKPSEDTPATAWIFAKIADEVGLPPGVFNVVQGFGIDAGAPLVASNHVDLISFTGSCSTGRSIQELAGPRLAKICMELGGKNALVVCDDADLARAVDWTVQSAFSNAGQRCAAASRVIVFTQIYDTFKTRLVEATRNLRIGPGEKDFLGPVINENSLKKMIHSVKEAEQQGASIVTGGKKLTGKAHKNGFYMAPTIMDNVDPDWPISQEELFGPVVNLYRVNGFEESIELVNRSHYGLTACIHTSNLHRAMRFSGEVKAGVIIVNGGTFGSEPHMGFGGVKDSGTGWREAGTEALDIYSDWKYINLISDPDRV